MKPRRTIPQMIKTYGLPMFTNPETLESHVKCFMTKSAILWYCGYIIVVGLFAGEKTGYFQVIYRIAEHEDGEEPYITPTYATDNEFPDNGSAVKNAIAVIDSIIKISD